MTSINKFIRQKGLTVVELMVGLLLSLLLMGGMLQVYLGTRTTYEVTEGLSRLQENTRFSADMLARDIRMAGYVPCSQPQNTNSIVQADVAAGDWWADLFNTPVRGFEGEGGTSSFPAEVATDAIAGSDAILILRGGNKVAGVNFFDSANNRFIMQRNLGAGWIEDGSLMVACDSTNATLFQASGTQTSTVTQVSVADNTASPGNSTTNLGYSFGNDAQLANYNAVIYYIVSSVSGDGLSLYRKYLNVASSASAVSNREELLEGVESMQLLYGIDSDGDGIANQYVKADDTGFGGDWQSVVTVRVGLLFASENGLRAPGELDDKTYLVANTSIGAKGGVTHAQDRRKRYVSSMTVSLRNI